MEVIADLLQRSSHDVEILSQGEVIKNEFKLYGGFIESNAFDKRIPVYYSSALPVRSLNGLWSGLNLLRIFKARHRVCPYDAVLIYNFKVPQIICARYAIQRLGLPVVLEYEDDAFVNLAGDTHGGFKVKRQLLAVKRMFDRVGAAIGVSPQLLKQLPSSIPKLLLRGVVSDEIANAIKPAAALRKNWVVYAGTLFRSKGLEQLITAWDRLRPSGWELHISGDGELKNRLTEMATNIPGIVFEGVLSRGDYVNLLCSAKIGINPHDVSKTPGNLFAFKIIEYVAAGAHVITTPMGTLEPEIEKGITYMPDNRAETIAATLKKTIEGGYYDRTASEAALRAYGPEAVALSLNSLLRQVANGRSQSSAVPTQR